MPRVKLNRMEEVQVEARGFVENNNFSREAPTIVGKFFTRGGRGGVGRPTLYDPFVTPRHIFEMRVLGLTDAHIAQILAVTTVAFKNWLRRYPDAQEAYVNGGVGADVQVAQALFKKATGWSHEAERLHFDKEGNATRHKVREQLPPDTTAAMYWLNNRQNSVWKSQTTRVIEGPDGMPVGAPTIIINPVMSAPRVAQRIEGKVTDVEEGSP